MFHKSGTRCVAILVAGTVGSLKGPLPWFSTGCDGNGSSSATSSALVLALYVPLSRISQTLTPINDYRHLNGRVNYVAKYPLKGSFLEIGTLFIQWIDRLLRQKSHQP
jgi:hypothetical protein